MNVYLHITHSSVALLLSWLFSSLTVNAQSGYNLVGSARSSSIGGCYHVTAERPGAQQVGAVWCNTLLHLDESFELEFTANFGSIALGADGIVMVMQTVGNTALGTGGSGLGFQGVRPSFGVEFDTHINPGLADPGPDHVALIRDGNTDHKLNSSFPLPVPLSTTSGNIKDGRDHLIKVIWNADTRLIQVYFDCIMRVSQSIDLINDIFGGRREVYWGITSASPGIPHTVCLPNDIVRDTVRVCQSEVLTLVSGLSIDDQYEWKPATGLDNPRVRTPHLKTTTNQLYTVRYTDRCSVPKIDSVYVLVKAPQLSLGGDREACENQVIELSPTLTPANATVKFHWSTGDTTRQLNPTTSGLYELQITADGCATSDSSVVTFHPLPKLRLQNEPTYDCPRDSTILLDPLATGSGLQFTWTPGGTKGSALSVNEPGRYSVKINTDFGCVVEQGFTILDNCRPAVSLFVPDAFTPNGDGINEVFEWKSNIAIDARMKIYSRWGETVFSSESLTEFWNGTWKDKPCPPGVYTWRLEYYYPQNKQSFVEHGTVLLLK